MKMNTIAGYSIALALAVSTGCRDEKNEQAQREAAICNSILDPLREEFENECSQKTAATFYNGSLDSIVKMRNIIVERYGCEREECVCRPVRGDYLPESKFKAVCKRR